jgi:hypothetical protein
MAHWQGACRAPGHAGRVRPAARRLRPAGPRRCAPNFAASSPATSSVAGSRLTLRPGWRRTQSGRAAPRPDRATTSTSPPDLGHGYASAAGVWFMRCLGSARRSGIGPSWRRGRITPFRLVVPTHLRRPLRRAASGGGRADHHLVTAAPPHGRQAPKGWAAASIPGKPPGVYRSCELFTLVSPKSHQW